MSCRKDLRLMKLRALRAGGLLSSALIYSRFSTTKRARRKKNFYRWAIAYSARRNPLCSAPGPATCPRDGLNSRKGGHG